MVRSPPSLPPPVPLSITLTLLRIVLRTNIGLEPKILITHTLRATITGGHHCAWPWMICRPLPQDLQDPSLNGEFINSVWQPGQQILLAKMTVIHSHTGFLSWRIELLTSHQ